MASVSHKEWLLKRLQDPEYASGYLNEALNDGSQEAFLLALRNVAQAKGIRQTAEHTDLNRESMYRMLSEKGNPNLSSLNKVLDSLGLVLSIRKKDEVAA